MDLCMYRMSWRFVAVRGGGFTLRIRLHREDALVGVGVGQVLLCVCVCVLSVVCCHGALDRYTDK